MRELALCVGIVFCIGSALVLAVRAGMGASMKAIVPTAGYAIGSALAFGGATAFASLI